MLYYVHVKYLLIFINSKLFLRFDIKSLFFCSRFLFFFSLRSFHHFKSNYARRLINALIENIPLTEKIFKSNEQILNIENRLKRFI